MRSLTVLYDDDCGFCRSARRWLQREPQYVPLRLVAAGSPLAAQLFPTLSAEATRQEITVVSDEGGVYRGHRAWLVCLWALRNYRELSLRLAKPAMLPLVRTVVATAARRRHFLGPFATLMDEVL